MKITKTTTQATKGLLATLLFGLIFVQPALAATTVLLDANGTSPGFWDGSSAVFCDVNVTNTWTTDPTGVAAPTVGATGDNFQFGNTASDFNGANITFNTLATTLSGTNFSIVATNATVTWTSTGNSHFNKQANLNISVATGSTLLWTSTANNNGYNFNNTAVTFGGGGTINFQDAVCANAQGKPQILNMPGGVIKLNQSKTSNYGATAGASFTVTNGTLQFAAATALADAFQAFIAGDTFYLNGGSIDNMSGSAGTINLGAGSYSVGGSFTCVGSSSLSLGNNSVTLTVSPTITVNANTFTIGGPVGDNGAGLGITKAGSGTLALAGANTFTGPTVINGGTLVASTTATGGGSYTVGDNSTLDISVGAVGQSLSMSSLTLGATSGGALQFDVGLLGNPTTAPIHLGGGTLTVNGTATPVSFLSISAITNYPVVIPLIAYGALSGNASSFTVGSFPPSSPPFQGYISNNAASSVIELVLTNGVLTAPPGPPKLDVWLGQTNNVLAGNWDTTTTNWISSGVTTNYSNLTTADTGDPVTFDDTLTGTTNVVLTTTLIPASITFNNNNSNYIFTGIGRISGGASLTMNGTGMVMLDNSGNDDFSGGLTINSGVLQIGANDTNGSPGTGAIVDNGGLVFNRADSLAVGAIISGSGSLTNNGSGVVNLSAVETYTGATVVNAGTLALSGPNLLASGLSASSGLTINGPGTVRVDSDNALAGTAYALPITINAGGVLTGNPLSDNGAGTSSHVYGLVTFNGGTLAMGGTSINAAFGSWALQGGVNAGPASVTPVISALDVIPAQLGGTTFNVVSGTTPGGVDLLVSGSLINGTSTHDAGVIKNGSGVMVLDNNNTYSHGTTVNGGTLQLGASNDGAALITPLGPGASTNTVTLNTGAILKFASSKGVTVGNPVGDDGTGIVLSTSGTNYLGGINTYSGQTIVNAGKLILTNSGSINNSAAIMVNNAAYDISAGGVVTSSGTLALTNSTLTLGTNFIVSLGNLTANNATLTFPVNHNYVGIINPITVTGSLTTSGPTNVINLTAVPGFPVYPTNVVLIRYGSFANVDGGNNLTSLGVSLPALGSPVAYLTNNAANHSIDLVVVTDTLVPIFPLTWNGQTNGINVGIWDILATPDWVIAGGNTPYGYQDTGTVTFDDTATGTTVVNLTTTVMPGSLMVSNAAKSYTIGGSGKISGSTSLVKLDTGTAAFGETGGDNFTGGITVGAGTLVLSNANVSISGGLTVNGGTLTDRHSGTISGDLDLNSGLALLDQSGVIAGNMNISAGTVQVGTNDASGNLPTGTLADNDTLIFDRSDSALIVTTAISGGGTLINNGTGSVTLSTTETLTGPVVVNAGTLIMNAGNNAAPNGISRASSLTINNGGTVAVLVDNSLAGHGAVAGTLPITINAGGVLTGAAGADAGAGTSTHIPGLLTLNGGLLADSGTQNQPANGSWDLDNGVATAGGPLTSFISALDIAPTEVGGEVFNVISGTTANGIDLDVTGTIIHATSQADAGIIKQGNGTMALDNNNTYTGGTTISGGVLQLGTSVDTNALTSPLGTGPVTINTSSILNLAGSQGVTVSNVVADDGTGTILVSSGVNRLTAANTYTGNTLIRGGTLSLTGAGSIDDSALIIVSNGTFDVSASSSAVASTGALVLTNGTFNLGTNLVTSLSRLALSNATLALAVNTNTPAIVLTGALVTGGATNVINVTAIPVLPSYPADITLIKYATADSGLTGANNNLTSLGVSLSGVGYLTNNVGNSSIDLVVVSVVSTNAATANFHATTAAGSLQFTWAPDHLGWQLYTNAISLKAAGSWFPVPGSATVTNETISVNPANPNVFFQLRYP